MTTLRKDAGIIVQINVFVWLSKNEVNFTVLDVLISAHLAVC
jgi:hypothetical protein